MSRNMLIEVGGLAAAQALGEGPVVVDCRFSLADVTQGRSLYEVGHIPGAYFLDLNLDLSGPQQIHGGRHPLPEPAAVAQALARCGIVPQTEVVAYDNARFAYASRLWWMMRSLGYRPPRLLNGGYGAWISSGGAIETDIPGAVPAGSGAQSSASGPFTGFCDRDGLLRAQREGVQLVDSREARRYQGLEEPIDPVAGHIPGAVNHPWQGVTDEAGKVVDEEALRAHWGDTLNAPELVVYCGSGVTACVNLFSLALLGHEGATLYSGSWSDWCSHL